MASARFVGRAAAILVLLVGSAAWGMTPAMARTEVVSSTPSNGARLAQAPSSVVVKFADKVSLDGKGSRLVDAQGHTMKAKVTAAGKVVTYTPAVTLPAGRYAAVWHVRAGHGNRARGAISFAVALPNPRGTPVKVATKPKVPTVISAALPGYRTLFLTTDARQGTVAWAHKDIPETITWPIKGDGTTARATGILPAAGTWSFTATLTGDRDDVTVSGRVRIGR